MNSFGEDWNIFLIEDGVDNIQVIQLLLEAMGNSPARFAASGAMFFGWLDRSQSTALNPRLRARSHPA